MTDVLNETTEAIRRAFAEFVPLSVTGLRHMVHADGDVFCFAAKSDSGDGLRLEGRSERYSAMSLIGLAKHPDVDFECDAIAAHLHEWAKTSHPGDTGLVLWSELLRGDPRAEATAEALIGRRNEIAAHKYNRGSMENGFLLIGLGEALRAGMGTPGLREFADEAATRLEQNRNATSGMFSFGPKVRRKNVHRARMDFRLGSFASQVYPTMGFSAYARATGDNRALSIAKLCADRICELQGPHGEWWWVYHSHRARTAVRYPVYGVHQDAMGPMALYAVALADNCSERYDAAVLKSLRWFDTTPDAPRDELVDAPRGVVWRAVQHDDPATTGRLGLGEGELKRMGRAAWLGGADERPLRDGFVCPECRPYHLGWVLLAAAMHEECVAGR